MKKPCMFKYFGGKHTLALKLIDMFPLHDCYVDVFGGAGNVLLQKPPSKVEVFNDIDSDIVNLFRQVRDNFDAFCDKAALVPHSREELYHFQECINAEIDPLDRSVMFYTIMAQSFNGKYKAGWSFGKSTPIAKSLKNKLPKLSVIMDRLLDVSFENKDFDFILEHYDASETFFYCDPPYLPKTRPNTKVGYKHEMTMADHETLIERLKNVQGKVMLSGYEHELYNTLGWQQHSFETIQSAAKTKTQRTEVVWLNYEPPDNLRLF